MTSGVDRPTVSVLVQSFAHARFIETAIQSVLDQEITVGIEILVGDDVSHDGTREVIDAVAARNPERLTLVMPDRNRGGHGKRLFGDLLSASSGRYVAVMDGDDFWTSPSKLQRQIDFLDTRPDCSMCFHNAIVVDEDGIPSGELYAAPSRLGEMTLEHAMAGCDIPAASPVFRREVLDPLPAWYFDLRFGDWPLYVLAAEHGRIGYLEEPMSAYRVHPGGMWSGEAPERRWLQMIDFMDGMDAATEFRHHRIACGLTAYWHERLAHHYEGAGDRRRAAWHTLSAARREPRRTPSAAAEIARLALGTLRRRALP